MSGNKRQRLIRCITALAGRTSVGIMSGNKRRGASGVNAHAGALQAEGIGQAAALVGGSVACKQHADVRKLAGRLESGPGHGVEGGGSIPQTVAGCVMGNEQLVQLKSGPHKVPPMPHNPYLSLYLVHAGLHSLETGHRPAKCLLPASTKHGIPWHRCCRLPCSSPKQAHATARSTPLSTYLSARVRWGRSRGSAAARSCSHGTCSPHTRRCCLASWHRLEEQAQHAPVPLR